MPKIVAWECPHTKKLFKDHAKYKKHLAALARDRAAQRKMTKYREERVAFWAELRSKVACIADIEKALIENWEMLCLNGHTHGGFGRSKNNFNTTKWPKLISLKIIEIRWSNDQSNTHSAPIGFRTNWGGREEGVPRGYPGWHGRILFQVDKDFPSFGSDIFKGIGFDTGAGSGGYDHSYRYEINLWADDFPLMNELREKKLVVNALGFKNEEDYA